MSLQPKSYEEALLKANSREPKPRKPIPRGKVTSRFRNSAQNRPLRNRKEDPRKALSGPLPARRGLNGSQRAINKVGPATQEWTIARTWLDRQFKKVGISACQFRLKGCWGASAVHYAHPAKRRHLKDGELYVAAKACDPCHDILDDRSKTSIEEMRALVEAAFNGTGIKRKVVA